ncbi:MAG: acetyl-CoA carboxylase biotin carboxyl carrier protein [Armatimonadota bacterium]
MEIEEIEQLVSLVKDAKISELSVTNGTDNPIKLVIRKTMTGKDESPVKKQSKPIDKKSVKTNLTHNAAAVPVEMYITAPMVGIFHGIESISTIGTATRVGQVIGSIESMKLMNDIVSEHDGVISEILVEDSMPVEFGQRLFKIDHK